MSTKATSQQVRRTPLSLTGGVSKQQHQNQHGKPSDSNGNSNNSASVKNQKNNTNQKTESNNTDVRESTPKEMKKQQNAERKQAQQNTASNETAANINEKFDEKKAQNGNGNGTGKTAATNGGPKDKHQNGNDKQDATNGTIAKSGNANSNGNTTNVKTVAIKTNEKTAPVAVVKEEAKNKGRKTPQPPLQQQQPQPFEKTEKEAVNEKEKEKKKDNLQENEKEKKEEAVQDKIVEKETRSRRHEASTPTEIEKKQTEKAEPVKAEDSKREVSTPTSRSSAAQAKSRSTPTRGAEKSGSSTPTKPTENKSNVLQRNKTVTTVIDDINMEPIVVKSSPEKPIKEILPIEPVAVAAPLPMQPPAATSTPGKALQATQKSKQPTIDAKPEIPINIPSGGHSPDRNSAPRTFTQIGGRRSIRPLNEYTPSKFQSNPQFRESYRRINTELDVSSTTNTSMNVTVGSEVPNSSSFSFFGRGRKRDRTPPQQSQSAMEVQTDADYSPPKRARYDMYSLFSVVSSPLTMLRSRFSKASIQSSTPVKLTSKLAAEDNEPEVQNVSGLSIEEEKNEGGDSEDKTATEDVTVGKKTDDDNDTTPKMESPMKVDEKCDMEKGDEIYDELMKEQTNSLDVHEVAAGVADTSVVLAKPKNKCNIM